MLHTLRFSLQNAVYFIILPFLVPVLFPFYIQDVLKFKSKTGAKRLNSTRYMYTFIRCIVIQEMEKLGFLMSSEYTEKK
jgi:ABC-type polysaccharide transport system permease subunit